jgi:hypothetical protein
MLGKLFRGKKLIGWNAIENYLGLTDASTLSTWLIWYSEHIPVKKENGVFVAYVKELKAWQAAHPDIKEIQRPPFELIQTRKVKLRWGRERIEKRTIIF